jgi:hypothetical protein
LNLRQVSNDQQLDAKSEIQKTKRLAHSGNGDRNMYHHIASLPILTLVIRSFIIWRGFEFKFKFEFELNSYFCFPNLILLLLFFIIILY